MTAEAKRLGKKKSVILLKGYFQITIVLTVEETCSDYWPALFSEMPKGGLFYR